MSTSPLTSFALAVLLFAPLAATASGQSASLTVEVEVKPGWK